MPEPQDFVPASAAADKEMAPWLESLRLMAGTLGPRRPFLPALTDLLRMLASRHAFLRAHLVLFEPETGCCGFAWRMPLPAPAMVNTRRGWALPGRCSPRASR